MSQAIAIMIDGYRELNSRKMFWITMMLSGIVVSTLLLVGITDDGHLQIAFWETPFPIPPMLTLELLLKAMFVSIGIGLWLTWAAAILALISTASIFPEFLSSGSIDLVLAKPIARARLFLLKYLSGLLFVGLQVSVFATAGFLIIGIRAGAWEPALFLAVPLVLAFFSYLFCVCTLLGVVTRSTLSALLLTLLFWLLLFSLNFTDALIMMPRVQNELYVEKLTQRLDGLRAKNDPADEKRIASLQTQLGEAEKSLESWRKWHGMIVSVKTMLPKTTETAELQKRWLIEAADLPTDDNDDRAQMPFLTPEMRAAGVRDVEVIQRVEAAYRERSWYWVIGTSLVFEVAVLALAMCVFVRRDF